MDAAAPPDGRGRRRRRSAPWLLGAALLAAPASADHREPLALSPATRAARALSDGLAACQNCQGPTLRCSGTTVADEHCLPCAAGQTWWPCNVPGECRCQDLAAVEEPPERPDCEIPLCAPGESGSRAVPFTRCAKFVVCAAGDPGPEQACAPGQAFSERINACNIERLVECPPDPGCQPTGSPSKPPTEPPSEASNDEGGIQQGINVGTSNLAIQSQETPPVDPEIVEGWHALDAHLAANKLRLARELLDGPGGEFGYLPFRDSLHKMILDGVDGDPRRKFYIGPPASSAPNGRPYGLVNVAMFLAMSFEDSIGHGSCDEVNRDAVGGVLPIANACGQFGMEYDRLTCPKNEMDEAGVDYGCPVDPNMRMSAGAIDPRGRQQSVPQPLYCRPREFAGEYTGHWDYVSGAEAVDAPAPNAAGRQDVEGCCWWGRGAVHLRGPCQYGKLNYYLGARAAAEGRPSWYPDVDFCADPGAVCDHPDHPELRWIAGLFRWIVDIQTYSDGEFGYLQRLVDFVDGGMKDWSFVHGVAGIATQGCHSPPCREGAEFDGAGRKATFVKALRLLGLTVDEGTATSRRLGEAMSATVNFVGM
ncbi:hypothetical protein ACHAXT_008268 [Thalassiosira profunda]